MKRRAALTAAGVICLTAVLWPQTVPLFDGVGFPDETYRFVTRPAGDVVTTKAPTSISVTVPVVAASTDGFSAASAEQGPQVSLFVPVKTLLAPGGAGHITVSVNPLAADGPVAGGQVDGNVYRFAASTDAGPATVGRGRDTIKIILRATSARQPGPVACYRPPGGAWTVLTTSRYGTDVYAAPVKGFGDFALVFGAVAASTGSGQRIAHRSLGGWLTIGSLIVGLMAILVGIRLARSRRGDYRAPAR